MKETIKGIKELANKNHDKVVEIRRYLHQYPELSFEEKRTSKYIASILKKNKISYTNGWAGYGIVAELRGELKSNKVIALRADIDALPILERSDKSYCSKNTGVMHACGHDVHSASLIGVVLILNEMRAHFGGTIKFIFQPGEEKLPGGASIMIKEGVLKSPKPSRIYGQHVHPPLEVGKLGFRAGKYMASADEIYMTIHGRGGHAALPQDCIDPVAISAEVISGLQQLVSRNSNPIVPSVLSFGKIYSDGGATNIIPNNVHLVGTFRTMDEKWRKKAHRLIQLRANHIVKSFGAKVTVEIKVGYPCLYNNEEVTIFSKRCAESYLGKRNVVELPQRLSSEDFAFYSQEIPACFYRLGTGNKAKGITSPVHTDTFDIDEDALRVSTGFMSYLALESFK